MKQLTIISGKGGTGKTSIAAAFAALAENAVLADCDVDAADLHIILKPSIKKTMGFHGLKIASINKNQCIFCNKCYKSCNFNAIDSDINLIKESCEGCGVCEFVCPTKAIVMVDRDSGFSYVSETRFGPMAHAVLKTAEEASGKLINLVRNNAKEVAESKKRNLIIIDGPPGIGCPVISSITGVDLLLVVTEPTLSAIHDLKRIIDLANHFRIPALVCINKYTINLDNTKKIEHYCKSNKIEVVGKIPYDTEIIESMVNEKSIIEFSNGQSNKKIKNMWNLVKKRLAI